MTRSRRASKGDGWVGRQSKVSIARCDKATGKRQDLFGRKTLIERLGNGGTTGQDVERGLMTSFDGEDRSSGDKVSLVGDQTSTSNVRADTNLLDQTSNIDGGCNVSSDGREIERAIDRGRVDRREGRCQIFGVNGFIVEDSSENLFGDRWNSETGVGKVLVGELGRYLSIELGLELL